MAHNCKQIQWRKLEVQIKKQWGKLSFDELSRLNGGKDDLVALLRKRYGYGKAQAEIEINKWLEKLKIPTRD